MQFGAVASQQAERVGPAHPRQQIHQGEQAQADRQSVAVAHSDGDVHRVGPAAGVAIGQREVAERAVIAAEAEEAGDAPALRQGGVAGGIPGALQVAAVDRRQLLGRQVHEVGQRPIGAGTDMHGRGMFGRFHRREGWTRRPLAPACASVCRGEFCHARSGDTDRHRGRPADPRGKLRPADLMEACLAADRRAGAGGAGVRVVRSGCRAAGAARCAAGRAAWLADRGEGRAGYR